MLSVLATLVGDSNDFDNVENSKSHVTTFSNERTETASTAATDEVLLEKIPFIVEVVPERDSTPLGITVSWDDDPGYLTIDDVRPSGLIAGWNATHPAELRVSAGHAIASVNGLASSAAQMLSAIQDLRKGRPVQLLIETVQRGGYANREKLVCSIDDGIDEIVKEESRLTCDIDGLPNAPRNNPLILELRPREGVPLGLVVSLDDDPNYVSIDGISSPGLIDEWNRSHDPELKVCVGDAITRVGRCAEDARHMLDRLTSFKHANRGAVLELTIETGRSRRTYRRARERTRAKEGK